MLDTLTGPATNAGPALTEQCENEASSDCSRAGVWRRREGHATVDFLTRELGADLVVRYCGGSQAGHNVVLPDGRCHTFSQFGAGTFAGAATYLGEQTIVNLPAMHKEAEHLREMTGEDPFRKLLVHPRRLGVDRLSPAAQPSPRTVAGGQSPRLLRPRNRRDTELLAQVRARRCLCRRPEGPRDACRQAGTVAAAGVVGGRRLVDRVPTDQHWRLGAFMDSARPLIHELQAKMAGSLAIQAAVPDCTTAIFEGTQGVLLDEWRGFHPYTTWSTVTLNHALAMVEESEAEEVCTLGVIRAYMTRHAPGRCPPGTPTCLRSSPIRATRRTPGRARYDAAGWTWCSCNMPLTRRAGRWTAWSSTAWIIWLTSRRRFASATGALTALRSSNCERRPFRG